MKKTVWFGLLLAAVLLAALSGAPVYGGGQDDDIEKGKRAQENLNEKVFSNKDVVGTAVGRTSEGEVVIWVFTDKSSYDGIPEDQDGVKVYTKVTGPISALPTSAARLPAPKTQTTTERWTRPVPIGVSTGNVGQCSAGTIGARVKDAGGKVFALSNNHVYALENTAPIGSNVLQPGLFDTGCTVDPNNVIGQLSAFQSIKFDGKTNNTMDAAIAISSTANLGVSTPAGGYGTPSSTTVAASLGQNVQKYGRTTQLTQGQVTGINATVRVTYSSGTAKFVGQVIVQSTTRFIGAGDSGSLLVTNDANKNPVGLLFAGNGTGTLAVANPIGPVLTRFGVVIDNAAATPPPFNNPPTVAITSPAGGASFLSGATISFAGTASDTENGDLTASLVWTSSINGQIGTGGSFSRVLSDGSHTITASVTDLGGKAGSASVSITVGNPPPAPSLTITVATDLASYVLGATVHISGQVTGSTGAGVAGATVTLIIDPPKGPNLTPINPPVTDASGNYIFNFTTSKRTGDGTYGLAASASKDGVGSNTASTSFQVTESD